MCPAKVGILLLSLIIKITHAVDFHVYPWGDISVPLIKMLNKTFHCNVSSGGNPFWSVIQHQSVWSTQSPQSPRDMIALNQRGITFSSSNTYATITVPGVAENNGTLIYCGALAGHGGNDFSTATPINLKIWGPPLPPNPKLTFHFPYNLEIHWEVPFSHDTIQGYNLQIISESSKGFAVLDKLMLHNETSYNFSLGNEENVLNCHILNITVTSVSALGESKPGIASTGFPTASQPFRTDVDVIVMFHTCRVPVVEIRFETSFICDFQTSNYTITIKDTSSELSVATRQSTYTGNTRLIVEVFHSGFQENKNYTLIIDIMDTSFLSDMISTSKHFNTTFVNPTNPGLQDSHLMEIAITLYAGIFGGIGLIIIVLVIVVILIIASSKIRKERV